MLLRLGIIQCITINSNQMHYYWLLLNLLSSKNLKDKNNRKMTLKYDTCYKWRKESFNLLPKISSPLWIPPGAFFQVRFVLLKMINEMRIYVNNGFLTMHEGTTEIDFQFPGRNQTQTGQMLRLQKRLDPVVQRMNSAWISAIKINIELSSRCRE